MVTNLTKQQIESIQIDESVIFLDYGETTERFLAPTRGGGEFAATVSVRDIEFDGRHGKTAGTQVIEEQGASIKVTTLCMSQENLALAIPNCTIVSEDGKTIKNPKTGVIPLEAYLKNITMFAKLISGKYKKITIYNPMHETGFTAKAVQKAEGELAFEFLAHYAHTDLDGDLWKVEEISEAPAQTLAATAAAAVKVGNTEQASADSKSKTDDAAEK